MANAEKGVNQEIEIETEIETIEIEMVEEETETEKNLKANALIAVKLVIGPETVLTKEEETVASTVEDLVILLENAKKDEDTDSCHTTKGVDQAVEDHLLAADPDLEADLEIEDLAPDHQEEIEADLALETEKTEVAQETEKIEAVLETKDHAQKVQLNLQ